MSDDEEIDEVFGDLAAFAGAIPPDPKLDGSAFGAVRQLEGPFTPFVDDELILGEDYVTYLLFASGLDADGFSLVTRDREIEVTTGDLKIRRALGVRVDVDDAEAECRNGVLSIRLRRICERDGGA